MVFDNCAVLSQVSLVLKHAMRVRMEVSAKKRRSSQFFATTKSQRSGSFLGGGTLQSQFLQPVKVGHMALHWGSGPTVVVQVQGSGLIQQTEGMYTPEHSGSRDNGIT